MKTIRVVIAAVMLIVIIAFVYILFFVGCGTLLSGKNSYPYGIPPPSDDATLWEKEQWNKNHGNVAQCGWFAEFAGPVVMYSSPSSTVSNISFRFMQIPGEQPHEISALTFILSTRDDLKTVRYGDPAMKATWEAWNKTPAIRPGNISNTLIEDNELVTIELDTTKMGLKSSSIGPGRKFVLVVSPNDDCIREVVFFGKLPFLILPGNRMEIFGGY